MGARFGPTERYEVGPLLGSGGVGAVFTVFDHLLERKLAGKFLLQDFRQDDLETLRAEARATASLSHPGIVAIHDLGFLGRYPYLLCEYVEGPTLGNVIRKRGLSPLLAVEIGLQVLEALSHAHSRGVWHHDVNPANIMLTRDGYVKLIDFGVGSSRGLVHQDSDTRVVGTPRYMAPEQWHLDSADSRADLWGVGATLQEMLGPQAVGQGLSNRSQTRASCTLKHHDTSHLPPSLIAVLHGALQYDVRHRFAEARQMLSALRSAERDLHELYWRRLSRAEQEVAAEAFTQGGDMSADGLVSSDNGSRLNLVQRLRAADVLGEIGDGLHGLRAPFLESCFRRLGSV